MSVVNRVFAAILVLGIASASTMLVAADNFRLPTDGQTVDQSIDDVNLPVPDAAKAAAQAISRH